MTACACSPLSVPIPIPGVSFYKAHQRVILLEVRSIVAEHLGQGTLSHCWVTCMANGKEDFV